jgi:tripartite-type tricarboxylate transporter receptor subunit TctC
MKFFKSLTAAFALSAVTAVAFAQNFPDKPVKVVMPYPAGTGPDAVMRHVGERLSKVWGQQVIVDNKPGGNGWVGLDAVKRAAPDGYTFLLVDQAIMSLHPYLYKKMPHDPAKDFEPAAPMYSTNYFITVAADSKINSFSDLIAEAKRRGSPLSYGSSGVGGQLHIGGALTEAAAGMPMTHVPNKDIPQMYVDVSQGRVDFAFATAASAGPLLKAGKLKLIAFAAPKRHPRYPDIKTVGESGGPADLQVSTWIALFAPAGVSAAVVNKVNADVAKIMATPETQEFLNNIGFLSWPGTAKELASVMKSDAAGYSDFVKKYKLSID